MSPAFTSPDPAVWNEGRSKNKQLFTSGFSRVHATIFQYLLHNFLLSICHQIHNTWQIPCITFLLVKLSYHQSRVVVSYFFNFHPYLLEKKGSIEFLWLAFFDWVVQLNHPTRFNIFTEFSPHGSWEWCFVAMATRCFCFGAFLGNGRGLRCRWLGIDQWGGGLAVMGSTAPNTVLGGSYP